MIGIVLLYYGSPSVSLHLYSQKHSNAPSVLLYIGNMLYYRTDILIHGFPRRHVDHNWAKTGNRQTVTRDCVYKFSGTGGYDDRHRWKGVVCNFLMHKTPLNTGHSVVQCHGVNSFITRYNSIGCGFDSSVISIVTFLFCFSCVM